MVRIGVSSMLLLVEKQVRTWSGQRRELESQHFANRPDPNTRPQRRMSHLGHPAG